MQHTPSFLNLIDKNLNVKAVSGPLEPLKMVPDGENSSPVHHSGVLRKMNGDFDSIATGITG